MGTIKVLVVEDESIIAQDMISRLSRMGYSALGPAITGEKAIEITNNELPDIILMDISLAGDMDGIEVASRIRAQHNIPVVYVTAFSDDKVLDRAKPTAPYGYLIKPFIEKELRATIETALYKHSVEEELRQSREQYRALLEASGAVPWEMDADSMKFTYVGPQAKTVIGIEPGEMDSFDSWLERINADDAQQVRDAYTSTGDGLDNSEIEYRIDLEDGRRLWIRDMVTSDTNAKGETRIRGYMLDITIRKEAEIERERHTQELQEALDRITTLQGLLPICAWCKKIRDDSGYWQQVEVYIKDRSKAEFTHSICPECRKNLEDELDEKD